MSLQLLRNEMTEAVMFGPDGNNILAVNTLQKNVLALRGSFRPVTKWTWTCLRKHVLCLLNQESRKND
jgi:hypothetical protein